LSTGLISYIVIFHFDKLISAILGEKEEEQKEEDPKVVKPHHQTKPNAKTQDLHVTPLHLKASSRSKYHPV
jgi:hypothetical protein